MYDFFLYILVEIVGAFLGRHPFLSFIPVMAVIAIAMLIAALS